MLLPRLTVMPSQLHPNARRYRDEASKSLPVNSHVHLFTTPDPDSAERALRPKITEVSCLQESGDGTDDGEHGSASLGSSAGELGRSRLGGGGSAGGNGVGRSSSVLGGVDGHNWGRSGSGAGLDGNSNAGLSGSGGRLDWDSGGVLAVVVNDGGRLGDGVGLGADLEGGGLRADGGKTLDGGGGVGWVLGSLGGDGVGRVLRGLGAHGVAWVLRSLGGNWVRGVLRSLGGDWVAGVLRSVRSRAGNSWVAGSRAGLNGVDSGGRGNGSEAGDGSEGAHVD